MRRQRKDIPLENYSLPTKGSKSANKTEGASAK